MKTIFSRHRQVILFLIVTSGANGVPLPALAKFVKRAFGYEQWETFDTLVEPCLELLREQPGDISSLTDMKTLELMLAMEPFFSGSKKSKKGVSSTDSGGEGATQGQGKASAVGSDYGQLALFDVLSLTYSIPLSLSLFLSFSLPPSLCLSVCLCLCLFLCLCLCLSVCLSIYLSVCTDVSVSFSRLC